MVSARACFAASSAGCTCPRAVFTVLNVSIRQARDNDAVALGVDHEDEHPGGSEAPYLWRARQKLHQLGGGRRLRMKLWSSIAPSCTDSPGGHSLLSWRRHRPRR